MLQDRVDVPEDVPRAIVEIETSVAVLADETKPYEL